MARPANPALALDIVRVTADLVEQKGPDQMTMREVAERLGYSATTIYLYYKDKDELLQATIDRAFDWFADDQDAAAEASVGVDVLRARARAYVLWALQHPNVYRLMFEHPQRHSPERSHTRRRSLRHFAASVQRLIDAGELRCFENVDLMCNLVWATLHGLVSLIISGRMFGPIGESVSEEDAKVRIIAMVDASFEQWQRVWAVEPPATNEFGECGTGEGCDSPS